MIRLTIRGKTNGCDEVAVVELPGHTAADDWSMSCVEQFERDIRDAFELLFRGAVRIRWECSGRIGECQ